MFSSKGKQPEQGQYSKVREQPKQERSNETIITAVKRVENPIFSQVTPKQVKRILLYGADRSRHQFDLVYDKDIGIDPKYQNIVVESYNDDDRKTTSTQLQRGMLQTLEDLYEVINDQVGSSATYYTQS